MISATRTFGEDVDVVCDIGGQDIKVLFLENGRITITGTSAELEGNPDVQRAYLGIA